MPAAIPLIVVSTVALLVACLSFFSGFGLGTLLMPAFAAFFPLDVAIAATAAVHLANNLFKLVLVGRDAHWPTVVAYGVPAAIASILGAFTLEATTHLAPLCTYTLAGAPHQITAVRLIVAVVIAGFAILELWPGFDDLSFDRAYLWLGGAVSGFFGGLSGHQGALRTAFLVRAGLTRDQFVGTRVVGAVVVDVPRLVVYALFLRAASGESPNLAVLRDRGGLSLVIAASLAAFAGSFVGSRLIKKVTMTSIHRIVGAALILMAVALATGLI